MTDVNGTRFHLVLGRDDWERLADLKSAFANAHDPAVSWDPTRRELTLGTRVSVFRSAASNRPPHFASRRGAAANEFGDIYWIGDDRHSIVVGNTTVFWPVETAQAGLPVLHSAFGPAESEPPAQPLELRGLAVSNDGYLFAGVVEPKGVLLFDLQTGGPPRQFLWPANVDFDPFDMVALPGGGVAILDRTNKRVWQLDRALGICSKNKHAAPPPEAFTPTEGDAHSSPSLPQATIDDAIALDLENPVAIDALKDGTILVLDTPAAGNSRVWLDGVIVETQPRAEGAQCRGHDCAIAGDILYVVSENGDQAFAFDVIRDNGALRVEARPDFAPMRLFTGRAIVALPDGPSYDSVHQWTPLVARTRGQYIEKASIVVRELDGKEPDCVWHRLFLDARIPRDCSITVRTRAANEKARLDVAPWTNEPPLLQRKDGSELPFAWPTSNAGVETWELLFQRAQGRFLDIELTLHGTGRATPRIRALRAWYPRFSYLERYLPRVYRQNRESASFVDRFLALFEGFFTTIEDRIAAAQLLLDAEGAPPDALEWLAGWFGVALDPAWDDAKRRLFLRHAAEFFEWRGTPSGLLAALRLALDDCVDEDVFAFGEELPRTGVRIVEGAPHRFSVVIPVAPDATDADKRMDLVRRVVALEKPAHAVFDVSFYWTWFRIGEARLGEDSVVDLGSRSPYLLAPYEINKTRIGSGYLAPSMAIGAGRISLGRTCARGAAQ